MTSELDSGTFKGQRLGSGLVDWPRETPGEEPVAAWERLSERLRELMTRRQMLELEGTDDEHTVSRFARFS